MRVDRKCFPLCLAALVLQVTACVPAFAGVYDAWNYRSKVQFTGYTRNETLANFPVLVKLGGGTVSNFSYGQFQSGANGDLRFADSTETVALNYEIESWDTNGTSCIWVQVPSLGGSNDFIYVYWGMNGQSALPCTTNGAAWTNTYLGVWHLNGNEADATSRTNNGVNHGSTNATGLAAGGHGFSGASAYIDQPANLKGLGATNAFAIQLWFRASAATNASQCLMEDGTAYSADSIYLFANANANQLSAHARNASGTTVGLDTIAVGTIGTNWHAVGHVYDGSTVRTYYDGTQVWSAALSGDIASGTTRLQVGCRPNGASFFLNGYMDEVRVESVARSSNWLWACYMTAGSNAAFQASAPAELQGMPVIENRAATAIGTNAATLNGYLASTGLAPSAVSVYWGPADGGAPTSGLWQATNTWAGNDWTSGARFAYQATDLAADTFYYFRYGATNSRGASGASNTSNFLAGAVQVSATAPSASEAGPTPGTFTVWRASSATNEATLVNFTLGGTAAYGTDYTVDTATNLVVIPAGQSNAVVVVTPVQDPFSESGESVTLSLLPGLYALDAASNASLTIADAGLALATNRTIWTGAAPADWFNASSWSLGRVPAAGDDVVVTNALLLTNATPWLRSCLVSNVAVTFSNWTTRLWVGYGVTVMGAGGRLTVPVAFTNGAMSNRVYISCGSLTVLSNAAVDVSSKGWFSNNGPGAGFGGSYGDSRPGYNPPGVRTYFGASYGSLTAPADPGSGGQGSGVYTNGGHGGGAVRIEATGTVYVSGSILANGLSGAASVDNVHGGGGSGGGIYITCSRLAGTTNGLLAANGGSANNYGWTGSGGRIAVVYDTAAQAGVNPGVRFAAAGGSAANTYIPFRQGNFQGTLYCSDASFLSTNMVSPQFSYVTFYANNFTNWAPASLTVANYAALDFGGDGFALNVAGDLTIGNYGTLGLRSHANATVGGNLTLGFQSRLVVRAGVTNALTPDYGALVAVNGDLGIGASSWIYPVSDCTNGGSALFRLRNLTVDPAGGFDATGYGYSPTKGPGVGGRFGGAGYGGRGGAGTGAGGAINGSSNAPINPGSASLGDAGLAYGIEGGGLIRIEASQDVTLNGKLLAKGGVAGNGLTHNGGGSGGGIFVQCRTFNGPAYGLVQASGVPGQSTWGGGGGGGRIAVWYGQPVPASLRASVLAGSAVPYLAYTNFGALTNYLGTNSVTGGPPGGGAGTTAGSNGTAVVIWYNPPQMAPIISNAVPTNILADSACLNGFLANTGLYATAVAVYWGDTDGGDPTLGLWKNTNTWAYDAWPMGSSPTFLAPNLLPSVPYYYRFYATNAAGASFPANSAVFMIANVWVDAPDPAASEDGDPGTFAIRRGSTATNAALTVNYTVGGTAPLGTHYTLSPAGTSVTLPAGVDATNITVLPVWDGYREGDQTVVLSLVAGGYVIAAPASNTVTIADAVIAYGTNQTTTAGNWGASNNWSLGRVPVAGDAVIVRHAMTLDGSSYAVASCLVTNGGSMTFQGWTTALNAESVRIMPGGTLAVAGPFTALEPSNRIWVACGDFTLDTNAAIDVSAKGYASGWGPGNGYGGSYGDSRPGYNPPGGRTYFGLAYGTPEAPEAPGSGGQGGSVYASGGHGGGAIRIQATGTVTVAGSILANGMNVWQAVDTTHGGGGSGGGIYITCSRFAGATNGLLSVRGGTSQLYGWSGSGGRIAVVYDSVAQAGVNPGVRFAAAAGDASSGYSPFRQGNYQGTLYCSDGSFLSTNLVNGQFAYVTFYAGNFTNWAPASLTVSNNTALDFGCDGFRLAVTGDLTIGRSGVLGLRSHAEVTVGGNVTLGAGSRLYIRAGMTNGTAADYGASLSAAGDVTIGSNSWIYPVSHVDDGGSVLLRMRNLSVDPAGGIDASGYGYGPTKGPGTGSANAGAGYGGRGGSEGQAGYPGGAVYGNSNAPVDAGSGGRNAATESGIEGGGLIRIEASQDVALNGRLLANGGVVGVVSHWGGGSGGGIFVQCQKFSGGTNGLIQANGSTGYVTWGGGGGGGRIAIWCGKPVPATVKAAIMAGSAERGVYYSTFSALTGYLGTNAVAGGPAGGVGTAGTNGTVVVVRYAPPVGTIFIIQ